MLEERRLNGYDSDSGKDRPPPKLDANGFIDYKVDFEKRLSEREDMSWKDALSEDFSEFANECENYYDENDQDQIRPEDDLDAPEIIYNIYGEIIGPESVLRQMEEQKRAAELGA